MRFLRHSVYITAVGSFQTYSNTDDLFKRVRCWLAIVQPSVLIESRIHWSTLSVSDSNEHWAYHATVTRDSVIRVGQVGRISFHNDLRVSELANLIRSTWKPALRASLPTAGCIKQCQLSHTVRLSLIMLCNVVVERYSGGAKLRVRTAVPYPLPYRTVHPPNKLSQNPIVKTDLDLISK